LQGRIDNSRFAKFGKPILNDRSDEPRGMSKIGRKLLCVSRGGGSASASGESARMNATEPAPRIRRSAFALLVVGSSAASGTISIASSSAERRNTRKLAKFETAQIGKDWNRSN